jgi:hypothetical protein
MIKPLRVGIVPIALLALAAQSASGQEAARQLTVTTRITGVVVDAILGRPIEGAIVSVVLQGHSAAQAETDSRGRYLIERELRTGRKDEIIRVFARGYFPEDHRTQLGCSEIVAVSGERAICDSEVNFVSAASGSSNQLVGSQVSGEWSCDRRQWNAARWNTDHNGGRRHRCDKR